MQREQAISPALLFFLPLPHFAHVDSYRDEIEEKAGLRYPLACGMETGYNENRNGRFSRVILKSRFASQNHQILMAFKAEEGGILAVFRLTRTKKDAKYGHLDPELEFSE